MYRGTDVGFGGYVYAEPGMYFNVPILDVKSMHPASIIAMNYFGKYTINYSDLRDARIAIKDGMFDLARTMLNGKLAPYLDNEDEADDLAYALKIGLNSAYGLTSASFENAMRDKRNVNNIVALRGALFMRTLQDEVQARGFTVAHIKTDSIKIPEGTPEIIQFCKEFAAKYDYVFEHEATYEKMCLVNNAVYIAKYEWAEKKKLIGKWTAVGSQFAERYVYKTLFTQEPIVFDD
jgi:DNA polymerase elongation subunit (family B)